MGNIMFPRLPPSPVLQRLASRKAGWEGKAQGGKGAVRLAPIVWEGFHVEVSVVQRSQVVNL